MLIITANCSTVVRKSGGGSIQHDGPVKLSNDANDKLIGLISLLEHYSLCYISSNSITIKLLLTIIT
jgi:hypothetical protein